MSGFIDVIEDQKKDARIAELEARWARLRDWATEGELQVVTEAMDEAERAVS